ncbi:ArsR/SmtB family transcription factor [Rhodovulum sp. DZ06]|uniref:ArsR/SmtB family transcription factor n=1 Tax=Rhodovulum sp. DZ06 TaxID=3425126 RepID=UPI003D3332D7
MPEGPDLARLAALIGDPARASMLSALMGGRALAAGELAREAGVAPQTASGHLSQLVEGGLLIRRSQGRARYYALAGPEAAAALEALMGFSEARGPARARPGPRDPELRAARTCYDHIAGALGVRIWDSLSARGMLEMQGERGRLSPGGAAFLSGLGVDAEALAASRRPVCRACLDWSERRTHLAGGAGAAVLSLALEKGWAARRDGSRALRITRLGESAFAAQFPV